VQGGGKFGVGSVAHADTWVLSNANGLGGTPAWTRLPDIPSMRGEHSAVYASASNRLIVFGGLTADNNSNNDVWVLRDANGIGTPAWERLTPSGTAPQQRIGAAVAYDEVRNRLIVFGGLHRMGGASAYR
jgi:hypothetical protein